LLVIAAAAVVVVVACARPETMQANGAVPAPSVVAKASPPAAAASAIDQRLQTIAEEELERVVTEWQARTGVIVVLDPTTGEVLANAGRDQGARADVAVRSAFPTGSTLKAFTLAAALEEGVISPTERIDCEHGERRYPDGRVLHDAGSYGTLSVPEMLAVSSNIGVSKVFDRLGGSRLGRWLRAFHFGEAPNLPGASGGWVPEHIEDRSLDGAAVATGGVATASPLQVAAAYAALAHEGAYVAPTLSRATGEVRREQIVKPETARTVVAMLEQVVNSERGTGKLARVAGMRVAGKTGTAEVQESPNSTELVYSSFVGFLPSTAPRFVILVGVENTHGWGPTVAAPVFARVAARAIGE
jgi:cell division protein FtsI (penicillin-binding protein 3)